MECFSVYHPIFYFQIINFEGFGFRILRLLVEVLFIRWAVLYGLMMSAFQDLEKESLEKGCKKSNIAGASYLKPKVQFTLLTGHIWHFTDY